MFLQTIYLDQAVVGTGPLAPTPAPAPSPIAPTGPIPGIPNFVEKIDGEPITQTDGTALVVRVLLIDYGICLDTL